MEESPAVSRPRQVTIAGWVGGGASLAMVLSVFGWMSRLTTVDTRDSLRDYLAEGSGKALGLTVDQALVVARTGLFVTGAAAAAMLVLVVFAMRREKSSRVAMSALALPILVFGVFVDPFLAGFMLSAVVLLWTRPATDWFLRRSPQPASAASASPSSGGFGHPPARLPPQLPPLPTHGPAQDPGPAYAPPPHPQYHLGVAPAGGAGAGRRPVTVLAACLIAGVSSMLMAVLLGISVLALPSISRADDIRTELEKQPAFQQAGMTLDQLIHVMQVLVTLTALWAVAAAVVALLALRGIRWARVALIVSSVAAGLLSLLFAVSLPPLLLLTAACAVVPVLLCRSDASRWYAGQPGRVAPAPTSYRPDRPW